MVELAYTRDLKSLARKGLRVQISLSALKGDNKMDNIRVLEAVSFLLDCELRRMEREGNYGFAHQGEQGELILDKIREEMKTAIEIKKRKNLGRCIPSDGRTITTM